MKKCWYYCWYNECYGGERVCLGCCLRLLSVSCVVSGEDTDSNVGVGVSMYNVKLDVTVRLSTNLRDKPWSGRAQCLVNCQTV